MKTIDELKQKLVSNDFSANKISKKEYIELGRNIDYVISPKTGRKITLGTFVAYSYPYSKVHSWEDLSRETLCDVFHNIEDICAYKTRLGFFGGF